MFLFWQYYHKIQFTREPGAEALRCVYTCGVCLAYACWLGWCTQMKVYMEVELWWFSLHIIPTFFLYFSLCYVWSSCDSFASGFSPIQFLFVRVYIVYSFMHYAAQYRTYFHRRVRFFFVENFNPVGNAKKKKNFLLRYSSFLACEKHRNHFFKRKKNWKEMKNLKKRDRERGERQM